MVVLTATCKNGVIEFVGEASAVRNRPLPTDLEGKTIQVTIEEVPQIYHKLRQSGSAKGQVWMSPDFDEPLADFQEYMG